MALHKTRHVGYIEDPASIGLPATPPRVGIVSVEHGDTGQHFSIIIDAAQADMLRTAAAELEPWDLMLPETIFRWVALGWVEDWRPPVPPTWLPGYPPAPEHP